MRWSDIKAVLRFVGIMLAAEGGLMALCLVPAVHFSDGTALPMALCATLTLAAGTALWAGFRNCRRIADRRVAYLLVVLMWMALTLFATLPLMVTGSTASFTRAFFEAMSGLTSTGATVFADVAALPASVLLWRSMTQWFGGFGIVLIVVAITPRLGINKYSLYTAEASGADADRRVPVDTALAVRRTLAVYLVLTLVFTGLLVANGMQLWDAVNLTFTNISSGGFSVNGDSIASLTATQQ